MRVKFRRRSIFLLVAILALGAASVSPAYSQTTGAIEHGQSGLPLPRFVSLKASRVNLRIGPSQEYAVEWLYLKKGLPLEIIQEYDNWRRVRDSEGTEGWIYHSLLSGSRTGIVAPWHHGKDARIEMLAEPRQGTKVTALLEPGAIGHILSCNGDWCQMDFGGHEGWVVQGAIWGAYPGETYQE